jgi:hypothetical protein
MKYSIAKNAIIIGRYETAGEKFEFQIVFDSNVWAEARILLFHSLQLAEANCNEI